MRFGSLLLILPLWLTLTSCEKDPPMEDRGRDLGSVTYDPVSFLPDLPQGYPRIVENPDNPMTLAGVDLGHQLFFDPILSADSTMSCASCHLPQKGFTDGLAVSVGIDGIAGTRSAMSVFNAGFVKRGLFWDGRSPTLEIQALEPVENPIEMHETWPNVENKLWRHEQYPELFRKAFGIRYSKEITSDMAAKAMAQYMKALVTGGDSKYNRAMRGETFFNEAQQNGFDMWFDVSPFYPDAECGHCHNGPLLTVDDYFNNGLDSVVTLDNFPDRGRGAVTGVYYDNGKFRAPSLINIELTAPYMHDGRFATLEEVIEHYNSGGHYAENIDANMRRLDLTEQQKEEILAFMKTFTDTTYLSDPLFQSPF